MQIKELDPNKRYFIILEDDFIAQEDIEHVSARLKALNVDAVVLAGASVRSEAEYWGVYFSAQHAWLKKSDGELYYYPSPHIAQAALNEMKKWPGYDEGTVREFDSSIVGDVTFEGQQLRVAK